VRVQSVWRALQLFDVAVHRRLLQIVQVALLHVQICAVLGPEAPVQLVRVCVASGC